MTRNINIPNTTKLRRKRTILALQIAALFAVPIVVVAYPDPAPAGYASVPGENGTCTGCHRVTAGTGNVQVKFPGATAYTPGVPQTLQVVVTDAAASRWGFELTARLASNTATQAGRFMPADAKTVVVCADDSIRPMSLGGSCPATAPQEFLTQNAAGTQAGTTGSGVYNFSWTPPPTDSGSVVFYVSGLAANNNGSTSGDVTYTASYTLTSAATAAPSLTATPTSLTFNYQIGGAAAPAQMVSVASSGAAIAFTSSVSTMSGGSWLAASPASGSTPGSLSVSVNPAGLAAGSYTGSVSLASSGASNSPQTVSATLNVLAAPVLPTISVSPSSLSFSYQIGGAAPAAQSLSVASSGAALSFTAAASGGSWLAASPASGMTPGSVSVAVNPSGMAAGTYTGSVTIAATGASNTPQTVSVTLTVTAAPMMSVSPMTLAFSYQVGGAAPAAKTISVGGSALNYTAVASGGSWLAASSASSTTPGSVSVTVNPSGMAAGTYNGSVAIAAAGASNTPQTVSVTLTVTAAVTSLQVSPGTMSFAYSTGGAAPAAQQITVASTPAAMSFTATASGGAWLSATSSGATTPGSVTVSCNPAGLAAGTYNGTVAIASSGAANSPQNVPVTLVVSNPGSASLKLSRSRLWLTTGEEEDNSSLRGSIGVTSTGSPLAFTASASGGNWLSVGPAGGTTPATLTVSVNLTGLAPGQYSGVISVTAPGASNATQTVAVTFTMGHSRYDGGEHSDKLTARPIVLNKAGTGNAAAQWVAGTGVPASGLDQTDDSGLLLSTSGRAQSGVIIDHAAGLTVSALGFDLRSGADCAASPRFKIVTADGVEHLVGGCDASAIQLSPSDGWTRYSFDAANPAHATPVIDPYVKIKSIRLMLVGDAAAAVVVDNIVVNGQGVNKQ